MESTLSNEHKDYLHALYLLLRTAPIMPSHRYTTFEAAACVLPSLSLGAKHANSPEPFACVCGAKYLPRAHRWARRERTEQIFASVVPLNRDTMLSYFYEIDPVRLAIAEIADDCIVEWPDGVPVPSELKKGHIDSTDGKIEVPWTELQIAAVYWAPRAPNSA